MSVSKNLRVIAVVIPILFVFGVILALRGTAKPEDLEVDKTALESAFLKKDSEAYGNTRDNVPVDPINFQIEQPDDTNEDSTQGDINQIINKMIEKEAKLSAEQLEAFKTTGNDMRGFEEHMTTPDFLEIDPFADEATTLSPDTMGILETQIPDVVQTEATRTDDGFIPVVELQETTTEQPVPNPSPLGSNLRRGDAFVYSVKNVLNLAPINQTETVANTDPIANLLASSQNNATVIPETNTTVYENGTVVGQLITPQSRGGLLELNTELPSTQSWSDHELIPDRSIQVQERPIDQMSNGAGQLMTTQSQDGLPELNREPSSSQSFTNQELIPDRSMQVHDDQARTIDRMSNQQGQLIDPESRDGLLKLNMGLTSTQSFTNQELIPDRSIQAHDDQALPTDQGANRAGQLMTPHSRDGFFEMNGELPLKSFTNQELIPDRSMQVHDDQARSTDQMSNGEGQLIDPQSRDGFLELKTEQPSTQSFTNQELIPDRSMQVHDDQAQPMDQMSNGAAFIGDQPSASRSLSEVLNVPVLASVKVINGTNDTEQKDFKTLFDVGTPLATDDNPRIPSMPSIVF